MGSRIMFLVGGLATLTTIINATTTAQLLHWLGISQTPWVKQQMINQCRKTMKDKTKDEFTRIVGVQEESAGTESIGLASMAIGHYSHIRSSDLRFQGVNAQMVQEMVPALQPDKPEAGVEPKRRSSTSSSIG